MREPAGPAVCERGKDPPSRSAGGSKRLLETSGTAFIFGFLCNPQIEIIPVSGGASG